MSCQNSVSYYGCACGQVRDEFYSIADKLLRGEEGFISSHRLIMVDLNDWVSECGGLWVSAQSKAIPRVRWRLMVNKYAIGQCPIIQTRRSTCFLPEHCFLTETSKYVPRALTQSFTAYFILGLIYLGSGALVSSARWWRGWAAQTSSEILRMADDGIV